MITLSSDLTLQATDLLCAMLRSRRSPKEIGAGEIRQPPLYVHWADQVDRTKIQATHYPFITTCWWLLYRTLARSMGRTRCRIYPLVPRTRQSPLPVDEIITGR